MKTTRHLIGLFEGMFEKNMLTFNPGWDSDAKALETFDDVRDIQKHLQASDIAPVAELDPSKPAGPATS